MNCKECGQEIPAGRLEAIPGVDTCVLHSEAVAITDEAFGVVDCADTPDLTASMQSTTRADRWS